MIRICSLLAERLLDSAAPVVARCWRDRDLDAESRLSGTAACGAFVSSAHCGQCVPTDWRSRHHRGGRAYVTNYRVVWSPRTDQLNQRPRRMQMSWLIGRTEPSASTSRRDFFYRRTETPRHERNSGLVRRQSKIPRATVARISL